jgi:hypothetical protein
MPDYRHIHLTANPVQRSKGDNIIAKVAYRACERIKDEREGKTHDYTRKGSKSATGEKGVLASRIMTQNGIDTVSRYELWTDANNSEKRKDACMGREYEFTMPEELQTGDLEQDAKTFQRLCDELGQFIIDNYKNAVDYSIHPPNKRGDQRNLHCHMMTTTRVYNNGFGEKVSFEQQGQGKAKKQALKDIRQKYTDICNREIRKLDPNTTIQYSKESYETLGIDRKPTKKMGYIAAEIERKADEMNAKGLPSERSYIGDINRQIKDRNNRIKKLESLDKSRFNQVDNIKFNSYFEKASHADIVADIQNHAEIAYTIKTKAETEKLTRADIEQYTYAKSFINGIDDTALEQKYLAEIAQEQAQLEADSAKQATVSNEADQIKKQLDTLKNIVGIVTQQLYERYSQVQPSQLKNLVELHQTIVSGLDDMASREVIPDFDSKVAEYSDSKNKLATIDQVTHRLSQLKAERERLKQAVSTAPEPQQSIVRSDKGNAPQLTPTPEQAKQAKLIALMQQNQESERQAKLEQQQAQLERQARLERQQAQLEAIKNKQPEPEQSPIVEPQHNLEPTPTPPPPPTVAERLEMVSIDPRLNYETRKGLEQLKAHIEAMPSGERQNKAIVEFNKVVGEQLEQQQSQSKGMDR